MASLPTLIPYPSDQIPNRDTMDAQTFADAVHPYLNYMNDSFIPQLNGWQTNLELIRQEINDKYVAVKNQAVDGGYSQSYLDTKFIPNMSRTYYVDQVNGDDNNDGSSGSPFKTLNKAINGALIGGYTLIRLQDDQTHIVKTTTSTYLWNKKITITRTWNGNNKPILRFISWSNGTYNYFSFFQGGDYSILFQNVDIEDELIDSSLGVSRSWGLFGRIIKFNISVMFDGCDLTLNHMKLLSTSNQVMFVSVEFRNGNLYASYLPQITFDYAACGSVGKVNFSLKDDNGNDLLIQDILGGVILDSNGNPMNVLSKNF